MGRHAQAKTMVSSNQVDPRATGVFGFNGM
jgi:hypothetical protein